MDVELKRGDRVRIWWPNGHGYDVLTVIEEDDRYAFELVEQYEVNSDGSHKQVWTK